MKKLLDSVAHIFMKTNIIEQMMIVAVAFMDISLFGAIAIGVVLFIIMDAIGRYKKRRNSK